MDWKKTQVFAIPSLQMQLNRSLENLNRANVKEREVFKLITFKRVIIYSLFKINPFLY
jgi:hypothetical protein